jgi:hypothetical protein
MLIREFTLDNNPAGQDKLLALSTFLKDRARDENSAAQISQTAFVDLAQSLGINITKQTLGDIINQDPLKNILEPLEPNSDVVRFKGNTEATTGMTVDQARATVDSNAKAAMKRRK